MSRSNRPCFDRDGLGCNLLVLLISGGSLLYGIFHFVNVEDRISDRMDRIAEKFGNAINITTNGSACDGSLSGPQFDYDPDNCPPPNEGTCHDLCIYYFDAYFAQLGPEAAAAGLCVALLMAMCLSRPVVDAINSLVDLVFSSCRGPRETSSRSDAYVLMNSDDVENQPVVGGGNKNTTLHREALFHNAPHYDKRPINIAVEEGTTPVQPPPLSMSSSVATSTPL